MFLGGNFNHLNHFLNAPHRPNERNRQKDERYNIEYTEIECFIHRLYKNDVRKCEDYERCIDDTERLFHTFCSIKGTLPHLQCLQGSISCRYSFVLIHTGIRGWSPTAICI